MTTIAFHRTLSGRIAAHRRDSKGIGNHDSHRSFPDLATAVAGTHVPPGWELRPELEELPPAPPLPPAVFAEALDEFGLWFAQHARGPTGQYLVAVDLNCYAPVPVLRGTAGRVIGWTPGGVDELASPTVCLVSTLSDGERCCRFGVWSLERRHCSGRAGPDGAPLPTEEYVALRERAYGAADYYCHSVELRRFVPRRKPAALILALNLAGRAARQACAAGCLRPQHAPVPLLQTVFADLPVAPGADPQAN